VNNCENPTLKDPVYSIELIYLVTHSFNLLAQKQVSSIDALTGGGLLGASTGKVWRILAG